MLTAAACPPRGARTYAALALLLLSLASPGGSAGADDGASAEGILADLNAAIQWFRDVRVTLRGARGAVGMPLSGDEEALARQALERAFAVARAKAALLRSASAPAAATEEQRAVDARAQVQQAIRAGEAEVARLQARARRAPAAQRAALERELTGARNRVELDRARLAFLAQLHAYDADPPGAPVDLAHQIETLQVSVPELKATGAVGEQGVTTTPTAAVGTWPLLQRLVTLRQTRSTIDDLVDATAARRRAVTAELESTRTELRTLGTRLHELADTRDAPPDMSAEQREFQTSLARARELGSALAPLTQEAALLRRFTDDMHSWQRAVDAGTTQLLKAVGIDLVRLLVAVGAVLLAAALWRIATLRYVADPFRRRLILGFRKVVLVVAVTIVVVVHFASELTTLVTALGFAAAGVAFALQNVILAVAGYFSMMAPNGIRVGDRVSLQGPFGYVHGEVLEIGFVRVRLLELAGDPLARTDRIVVFPNSVVFTGSFFKHPDGAVSPPGPPATTPA